MQTSAVVGEALSIQRLISTEMSKESSMPDKVERILKAFADSTGAKQVLLYSTVDDNYLEFMGGCHAENYKTNIRFDEDVVGRCAATKRLVGEANEQYNQFWLTVPLLRLSNVIGVLVLIKGGVQNFSESQTELAETLALVLSDFLSAKEFIQYRNQAIREKGFSVRDVLRGVGLNKGYGAGSAVVHYRHRELLNIFAENIELEKSKLFDGQQKMIAYIDSRIAQANSNLGNTSDIMEAYRMFATDKGWYKKITADIEKGYTAEAAIEHVYEDIWNKLSATNDIYLKEKLSDLRDVSDRLRSFVAGGDVAEQIPHDQDIVIIAHTMGPADLMDYDYERVRGLIIEDCTPTMHVVIVAKALNIPVIAKIHGVLKDVKAGEIIAVNGAEGVVYLNPNEKQIEEYRQKFVGRKEIFARLEKMADKPAVTTDEIKINMSLNYGLDLDFDYIKPSNCDGIGLYRTEITFMATDKMPDVDSQERQYKRLFNVLDHKKIVFRSLDVGSDKLLPYWGEIKEDNPAIGWRSIRITLDRRAVLRQQMRAMLRAAADKDLYVMFPMISTVQEFLDAKETLMLEYEHEKQHHIPVAKAVKVGIMIEVPSILFQLDEILQLVDFVSVGTNDLYQFVYACDRSNPRLSDRYDVLSAPFLKLMKQIVDKANQYKVPCSVCGEMAGNPLEAMCLIGLGYRNLSVSGAAYAQVKQMIRTMCYADVSDYIRNLLKSTKTSLRSQLAAYAYDHAIAID